MHLKETLFHCLPAGRYAMAGLLRLLDVVETDTVPSAAVECHAQPRLLINPAFVSRHASTPEKLMMLVMHEVHHVLLGHTRRLPSQTGADNFVFDCVINALLCRMFPQPEYTALFRDFYPEDRFPACLLRPPEHWHPEHASELLPSGLQGAWQGAAAAREIYLALYSGLGASYEEVRRLLSVVEVLGGLEGLPLLGDHAHSVNGSTTASESAFAGAVGALVRHWPTPPDPLRGQSLEGLMRTSHLTVERQPGNRQRMRRLIRKLADGRRQGSSTRHRQSSGLKVDTPVPVLNRRAIVSRSLGLTPLLYQDDLFREQTLPAGDRVHLYLDVSGSMEAIKGAIYGAVLDCERWLAPQVHLFSTEVAEATPKQLRRGYCASTGGTDIGCVIEHMKKNRVRRALLLTDGYVGQPQGAEAEFLQGVLLGVAYTECHDPTDLAPFADHEIALSIRA